jgi:hypothetical protein
VVLSGGRRVDAGGDGGLVLDARGRASGPVGADHGAVVARAAIEDTGISPVSTAALVATAVVGSAKAAAMGWAYPTPVERKVDGVRLHFSANLTP